MQVTAHGQFGCRLRLSRHEISMMMQRRVVSGRGPCLADTGGVHIALGVMELQDCIVPGKLTVLQHAARPAFLVGHQRLVGHSQDLPR